MIFLLWILAMIIVEGGAVALAVLLWKKIDDAHTDTEETCLIIVWIFTILVAIVIGIALVATIILGTMRLFSLYG